MVFVFCSDICRNWFWQYLGVWLRLVALQTSEPTWLTYVVRAEVQ